MSLESQHNFWKLVLIITPVIAALIIAVAGYKVYILNKKINSRNNNIESNQRTKDKQDILDAINNIKESKDPNSEDKQYPGYTIALYIKIEEMMDNRRKFIFDIGKDINKNRVSMYLDGRNNLIYRIIDAEGEPHILKIPKKEYVFQLNKWYFIICDYGYAEKNSFMRLFIDDKLLERNDFNFKINLPTKLNYDNALLAADIEKKYFGKLTISFYTAGHATFTKLQRRKLREAILRYIEAVQMNN
jgi:hypothetical protein